MHEASVEGSVELSPSDSMVGSLPVGEASVLRGCEL